MHLNHIQGRQHRCANIGQAFSQIALVSSRSDNALFRFRMDGSEQDGQGLLERVAQPRCFRDSNALMAPTDYPARTREVFPLESLDRQSPHQKFLQGI
jgi:hypothetical protein